MAKVSNQGDPTEEIEEIEYPYHVKDSIINLLFNPDLLLSNAEVVKQDILAIKIEQCDGEILLEDEEYDRIKKAFDTFKGYGRDSVELVRRINEAPVVEVGEKPKEE